MLIYNTTFVCEESKFQQLAFWLDAEFIPNVIASKIAVAPQLARVIPYEGIDESAASLSLQFKFLNSELLDKWINESFSPMIEKMNCRFEEAVLHFSTVLELIGPSNQN